MSAYKEPIKVAIIVFPFLALAISSILLIREYRKYGTFLMWRAIVLYSFIFYLLCAYFLVILPLPPRAEVAQYTSEYLNLDPLASWHRFRAETVLNIHDTSTFLPALKQGVLLEPLFNVILTIPFGVYLRYYYKASFGKTVLFSFLLSLFFELTQLSGLYFIYPRPYRLADVDDLIMNTLGGTIGFIIAPMLTFLFPSRAEMDEESYEKGTRVSLLRRFVAFVIDWLIIEIAQFALLLGLGILTPKIETFLDQQSWLLTSISVIIYFMLIPWLLNGQTPGKKVVRIRITTSDDTPLSFGRLFARYGILYLLFGNLLRFINFLGAGLNDPAQLVRMVSLILFLGAAGLLLLFFGNIVVAFFQKRPRLVYEIASKTQTVSTIPVEEDHLA